MRQPNDREQLMLALLLSPHCIYGPESSFASPLLYLSLCSSSKISLPKYVQEPMRLTAIDTTSQSSVVKESLFVLDSPSPTDTAAVSDAECFPRLRSDKADACVSHWSSTVCKAARRRCTTFNASCSP
mmetsp:Transcript_24484/g.34226  ORF Transcript_24484/g.34226 Transcript_24484/m.34226 type:complete len:128 (-) Transcript_24484:123-506(-)